MWRRGWTRWDVLAGGLRLRELEIDGCIHRPTCSGYSSPAHTYLHFLSESVLKFFNQLERKMIEGLKVTVAGTEVAELATKQASFHRERQAFYKGQLDLYSGQIQNMAGVQYSSMQDPRQAAQQKHSEHENKALHLEFIASHLRADEQYLLESKDLQVIGVVRERGFF